MTPHDHGREAREEWEVVRICLPPGLARYVVHKGSITVDGISLTVSAVGADGSRSALSPRRSSGRRWAFKQPGDQVNLEVDVIAKYVEKLTGGAR